MAFKIKISVKDENKTQGIDYSINTVGNFIVSLTSGSTRTKGKVYQVILDPKSGEHAYNRMWYISDAGHPVNCLSGKFKTFKLATPEQIDEHKNGPRDDS